MTAEIAIMNKQGVALAADSAVSIGTRKVYNSANKLFALSCSHPVGIMIYGNAEFMGIPWETIIKYYRTTSLEDKNFDTIEDFAEDFLNFVRTSKLFNGDHEELYVCQQARYISSKVRDGIVKRVTTVIDLHKSIDAIGTAKCVSDEIENRSDNFLKLKNNSGYTSAIKQKTKTVHSKAIKLIVERVFENIPLTLKNKSGVIDLILNSFGKEKSWGSVTGIVVAGFGEKEIFPSVAEFSVEGRVGNYIKATKKPSSNVTLTSNAIIKPFAQREMVDTFMSGMDPSFLDSVTSGLKLILHKIPEMISKNHGVEIPGAKDVAIIKDLDDLLGKFSQELSKLQKHSFVNPVLDSVGALPLDELASMAEALVNLTSFKRRVTMVQESVGGPVDVAVISKGDGFIWIKRKHYFEAKLNHHFFER
jgi:hypothetical protein